MKPQKSDQRRKSFRINPEVILPGIILGDEGGYDGKENDNTDNNRCRLKRPQMIEETFPPGSGT